MKGELEESVNKLLQSLHVDKGEISDGYHTFNELYEHRIALFIALCHVYSNDGYQSPNKRMVWKSKVHSDGSLMDGWFIAGIGVFQGEQITYHLPMDKWDSLHVRELEKAPLWDGHIPSEVVKRLEYL